MNNYSPDFRLEVEGVKGFCAAGERYAQRMSWEKRTPVLSYEGPCIRGEIARLVANTVAREVPSFDRTCHAETFFVPHSSMARWVKGAEQVVMIDGCFLKCHGRVLGKLVGADKVVQFDALPFYKKCTDVFLLDDVPEAERNAAARQAAHAIIDILKRKGFGEPNAAEPAARAGAL